jgi:hypothetical protein
MLRLPEPEAHAHVTTIDVEQLPRFLMAHPPARLTHERGIGKT